MFCCRRTKRGSPASASRRRSRRSASRRRCGAAAPHPPPPPPPKGGPPPPATVPHAITPPHDPSNAAPPAASTAPLGEAEQERYRDVEAAPSLVQPDVAPAAAGLEHATPRTPRRRLVLWPIAAALAVGIGAGFLGGYGVGSRDRLEVPGYDVSPAIPSTPRAPATAAT